MYELSVPKPQLRSSNSDLYHAGIKRMFAVNFGEWSIGRCFFYIKLKIGGLCFIQLKQKTR